MTDSQRNLLILLVVAVAGAAFSGVFNVGAGLAGMLLNIAFTVAIVWVMVLQYQRHSGTIARMPIAPRLVLQVAGVALMVIVATGMLHAPFLPYPLFGWSSGYPMIFWPSLLLCGFGIWWGWQQRTSRW